MIRCGISWATPLVRVCSDMFEVNFFLPVDTGSCLQAELEDHACGSAPRSWGDSMKRLYLTAGVTAAALAVPGTKRFPILQGVGPTFALGRARRTRCCYLGEDFARSLGAGVDGACSTQFRQLL